MPWTGALMIGAPIAGHLADRFGERRLICCGLALQAAGMGWLAVMARPGLPYSQMLLPPLIIGGWGI